MQRKSLKNLLDDAVNKYLDVDNKEPTTTGERVTGLFSKQGAEGRRRAKQYKIELAKLNNSDEDELFQKVYNAASSLYGEGLGTSIKLRVRLMEALCSHRKISPDAIMKQTSELNQVAIHTAACTRGHTINSSYDENMIRAMAFLLRPKINYDEEIELKPATTYKKNKVI